MELSLTRCLRMSGRSEGLRRRRTHYYKSDAFKKSKRQDVLDFRVNHSDKKSWWDCIKRIAIAQSKIGVKDAMDCVESVVRNREMRKDGYIYCSPQELEEALRRMRKIYLRNQKK